MYSFRCCRISLRIAWLHARRRNLSAGSSRITSRLRRDCGQPAARAPLLLAAAQPKCLSSERKVCARCCDKPANAAVIEQHFVVWQKWRQLPPAAVCSPPLDHQNENENENHRRHLASTRQQMSRNWTSGRATLTKALWSEKSWPLLRVFLPSGEQIRGQSPNSTGEHLLMAGERAS